MGSGNSHDERSAAWLRWLDGWRAALAAWIMPPAYALWTFGQYTDDGYDELVVEKEPRHGL